MPRSLAFASALVSLLLAACASGSGAASTQLTSARTESHPEAAKVWHSRCGSCHRPVEPGTRERAHLEKAFTRHRTRVKLAEPGWADMIDFLAAPTSSARSAR
jgi:nucleoside-specific outer membrane channel protein Tsx